MIHAKVCSCGDGFGIGVQDGHLCQVLLGCWEDNLSHAQQIPNIPEHQFNECPSVSEKMVWLWISQERKMYLSKYASCPKTRIDPSFLMIEYPAQIPIIAYHIQIFLLHSDHFLDQILKFPTNVLFYIALKPNLNRHGKENTYFSTKS